MGIAYGKIGNKGKELIQTNIPKKGNDGEKRIEVLSDDEYIKTLVAEPTGNEVADVLFKFKLDDADQLYRNRNIEEAKKKYHNLASLSSFEDSTYLNDEVYQASMSQLRKIQLGLNYFGQSPLFVPLLDRSLYESRMERLLEAAHRAYENYSDIQKLVIAEEIKEILKTIYQFEVTTLLNDLNEDIAEAHKKIELYEHDIEFYKKKHQYLADEIKAMMSQEERLIQATSGTESFDFLDFIMGAAKVYTGGKSVIAAWKATSIASASDVFDFISDNDHHLSKIAKGFSKSGILSLFSSNKKKIYSEVDLLPLQNQIREFTYEVLDISQQLSAANLKITLEKSRISSLTMRAMHLRENQVNANYQLETTALDLNELEIMKGEAKITVSYIMDMANEYLFYYARALQFWNHQNAENEISYENNPDQIRLQFERVKDKEIKYYQSIAVNYTKENDPVEILFERNKHLLKFQEFDKSGIFNFSLGAEHFPPEMRLIRMLKIGFELEGEGVNGEKVIGFLAHDGESRFVTEENEYVSYTHSLQKIFLKYRLPDFKQLNSDALELKKAYLSPLANWRLILQTNDNDDLDRRKIDKILIRCQVLYKPFIS